MNQGEVQIINSGISELGSGGESPQSTFMAFKVRPTENPVCWQQDQPGG